MPPAASAANVVGQLLLSPMMIYLLPTIPSSIRPELSAKILANGKIRYLERRTEDIALMATPNGYMVIGRNARLWIFLRFRGSAKQR